MNQNWYRFIYNLRQNQPMEIQREEIQSKSIKFSIEVNNSEIARISLYLIYNNLHQEPYGLIEDLFVEPEFRNQGFATKLITSAIKEAKEQGCYKLIGTSRHGREPIHEMYKRIGFQDYGKEFRMNLGDEEENL